MSPGSCYRAARLLWTTWYQHDHEMYGEKILFKINFVLCLCSCVMYLNWMTETHLVQVSVLCPPSCRSASGAGDIWRFWSWKMPSASLEGPKSLQANTAQWVGAHCNITQQNAGCLRSCHWQTELSRKSVWLEESGGQQTYAALTAAGVEPGRGLPSEDGDPTTYWVAAVRLCKRSHTHTQR